MATVTHEQAERDENLRVLKNGAIYDMKKKRIVANPGGGTAAITKETASEMQARNHELKRKAMRDAANSQVERGEWKLKHGDLAFVAAIADSAMIKATTPDDPKAIDAARFLLQETGMSEKQAASDDAGGNIGQAAVLVHELNKLIAQIVPDRDVIDVDASE